MFRRLSRAYKEAAGICGISIMMAINQGKPCNKENIFHCCLFLIDVFFKFRRLNFDQKRPGLQSIQYKVCASASGRIQIENESNHNRR